MNHFTKVFSLALGIFLITGTAFAQSQKASSASSDSITTKELKKFAHTTQQAQQIQQRNVKELKKIVQSQGMTFSRFQKIMMSKRNPKMAKNVNETDKEKATIQKIQPKLMAMNQKAQKQFVQIIKKDGLTPQRFRQILKAVQTDPGVSKRFQKINSQMKGANKK